jgi:hypothetical protein
MPKRVWTPADMGRKGGQSTSAKKVKAARRNAIISAVKRKLRRDAEQKAS